MMGLMKRLVVFFACIAWAALLAGCAGVDYSPDGQRLAVTWPLGTDLRLAVIGVDGTGFKYISAVDSMIPAWAPDNRRIAFANEEGLWVADTETGRSSMILPEAGPFVAWSEDGGKLATFAPSPDGEGPIQVVWYDFEARGITLRSAVQGLTDVGSIMPDLVWIPRTSGLAFVANFQEDSETLDERSDVYLMEAGETKRITTTGDVVGLALEPGGKRLVWARRSKNPKYILFTLYAYDLVNRSVERLEFTDRVAGINPNPRTGPDEVQWVSFSPTLGNMLVWTGSKDPKGEDLVYVVDRVGKDSAVVGRATSDDKVESTVHLAWSPDGLQMAGLLFTGSGARLETRNNDGTGARTLRKYQRQ